MEQCSYCFKVTQASNIYCPSCGYQLPPTLEKISISNLVKVPLIVLISQNIFLFLFFLYWAGNGFDAAYFFLLDLSMYLDLIGFTFIFLICGAVILWPNFKLISSQSELRLKSEWLLICLGSLLFVIGSLSWRPTQGFLPNNPISELSSILLGSDRDEEWTGDTPDPEILLIAMIGLAISNFGLLLYSFGFGRIFNDHKNPSIKDLMIIYGVVNFVCSIAGPLVLVKPIIAPPLVIVVYWRVITANS